MFFQRIKLYHGTENAPDCCSMPFSILSAANTNATQVIIGPHVIVGIHAINVNAAARYLKFYDIANPPTAGQGIPCRRYGIPGATTGAGFVYAPAVSMRFVYGIGFTITGGAADSDTTAIGLNDIILTLEII